MSDRDAVQLTSIATTTALNASASWTSSAFDVSSFSSLSVVVYATGNTSTLTISQSLDRGSNFDHSETFAVADGTSRTAQVAVVGTQAKVSLTVASGSNLSALRLHTTAHRRKGPPALAEVSLDNAQITVALDSAEDSVSIVHAALPASIGQKASAASFPVVLASDQSSIPVSGTVSVSGVATEATLSALDAKVTAVNTGAVVPAGNEVVYQSTANVTNGSTSPGTLADGSFSNAGIASYTVQLISDTTGVMTYQSSEDNNTWTTLLTNSIAAGVAYVKSDSTFGNYTRIYFTNDSGGDTTSFSLQIIKHNHISPMASAVYGTGLTRTDYHSGVASYAVRDDALSTLAASDDAYTNLRVSSRGALWTAREDLEVKRGAGAMFIAKTSTSTNGLTMLYLNNASGSGINLFVTKAEFTAFNASGECCAIMHFGYGNITGSPSAVTYANLKLDENSSSTYSNSARCGSGGTLPTSYNFMTKCYPAITSDSITFDGHIMIPPAHSMWIEYYGTTSVNLHASLQWYEQAA